MPTGACPDVCTSWIELADLPAACADVDPNIAELYLLAVSNLLYKRTGRQWPGSCQDTVRPTVCCRYDDRRAWPDWYGMDWQVWNASWGNCGCHGGQGECCPMPPRIDLGRMVTGVEQVTIDGAVLPPNAYEIHDFRWLVRTDGDGWPVCQDLALASTEPDTFEVTFTYGTMPPADGKIAAIAWGEQLLKAYCNDASCTLPERIQTITREGVTAVLLDPHFSEGSTGVYLADEFIKAENPAKLSRRGSIGSPDRPGLSRHRVTG